MTTNEALSDETTSINSIYEPDTLLPSPTAHNHLFSLRLPALPSIVLRIEFPSDYPDAPPSIPGTESVGDGVEKGVGSKVVDLVRDVLAECYRPGEPCIFDLLEEVREKIESIEGTLNSQSQDDHHENTHSSESVTRNHNEEPTPTSIQEDLGPEPPWVVGTPITEKKSVFLARCAPVASPAQAKSYIQHLLATDKKAARATHNITAWRIRGPSSSNPSSSNSTSGVPQVTYQDCDDDGETAAGGRVLHLMQMMDVWDVMVVVTRWYGGVLLGPDRFRLINQAAREGWRAGGYVQGGETEKGEGRKKGKR